MSDDYTPTTEEVREDYASLSTFRPFYDPENDAKIQAGRLAVDRWLAAVRREAQYEQCEKDARIAEAGGVWWDPELVMYRSLYPAEIGTAIRAQFAAENEGASNE